jgi:uncharacterized coiled-coil protein SlyX
MGLSLENAERRIRELEGRVAHQKTLAAKLSHHGYHGAAAEVLSLVGTLQDRLGRNRDYASAMRAGSMLYSHQ